MEGGPPPLAPLEGGPVQNVQQMLFSLKVLISHIMDSSMSLEVRLQLCFTCKSHHSTNLNAVI
jgi:hypothetical protein